MTAPLIVCLIVLPLCAATGVSNVQRNPPPAAIGALRHWSVNSTIAFDRVLPDGEGYSAYLISYCSSGLKVFAMVAVPKSAPPKGGYPVLIANHGNHPNPPRYGFTPAGADARPGDYYRPVPELYTSNGFLVVIPDYRGHNASEGSEFAHGLLASAYYTEDVLALVSALPGLKQADLSNVFMWGHSMGGEVTLRALLATTVIRGASLWSSVGGDIWDQAQYYSRYRNPQAADGSNVAMSEIDTLRVDIANLSAKFDWRSVEPLRHLKYLNTPLVIHHSLGDTSAPYEWSERLSKELSLAGKPYSFYSYTGTDHFFEGNARRHASARDVDFFRSLMRGARRP